MKDLPLCAQGHTGHPTTITKVDLGRAHMWRDYPQVPARFAREWEIEVFDAATLDNRGGYCPGLSNVSTTLNTHHLWEPPETVAMLCAMERWPDAVVNDVGANIGYYTTMASQFGLESCAYEPDPDVFEVLRRNRSRSCPTKTLLLPVEFPDDGFEGPTLLENGRPIIVKVDVEGMEPEVLTRIHDQIDAIVFAMIEVTPAWGNYESPLRYYHEKGFALTMIPVKSYPPSQFDTLDDLDWSRSFDDLWSEVSKYHQSTVLMARM